MGCMAKKFLFILLFTVVAFQGYSAELKANVDEKRAEYVFTFQKGYSAFEQLLDETSNTLIFTFDTSENIAFERQNYFDMPIKSAYLTSKDKKRFFIEFKNTPIEPIVNKTNRQISIVFPLPEKTPEISRAAAAAVPAANPSMPTTSSYIKMISGLIFVLILIFLLFFVLKIFFKKQLFSDIPGSGRLLGKVDLDLRKSLYFYEIGDIIYIIGITDNGMNVIDKISDEAEAAKIRAGFIKKHDFKGYMSFFKRKAYLDDDLTSSNAIVEEKLNSIRSRKKQS